MSRDHARISRRTLLFDIVFCLLVIIGIGVIPPLWHSAEGVPNCGRLYFHLLDTDTSQSGNRGSDLRLAVYSLYVGEREDTSYTEVEPYPLGEGWYIVDNCSPRKKITITYGSLGMEIVAEEMPSQLFTNVVIDSIALRGGSFTVAFDPSAPRFTRSIPGQSCDDCIDITPRDWGRARTLPEVAMR